jgi:hypothetical protein
MTSADCGERPRPAMARNRPDHAGALLAANPEGAERYLK